MQYFTGIVGHAAAKDVLAHAIAHPRSGYLIEGSSGVGGHALAEAFVRALTDHPADRPLAAHPDIVVLRREWNDAGTALKKEIAVREVRALRMRVSERPVLAKRVVAYVPDADRLNEEGVNALLKSVEEPPADAVFVLVAHQPGKLPATLLSRVQRLALRRVASEEIRSWLVSSGVPHERADAATAIADGRPGIAQRFLNDPAFAARIADAERIVAEIAAARTPGAALAAIAEEAARCDAAEDAAAEWRETLSVWNVALRRRIILEMPEKIVGIGDAFLAAERHVGGPVSPRIILELGLNRVASGQPVALPGWTRSTYPFPVL